MKKIIFLLSTILIVLVACKPEHMAVPTEPLKDLSGTWLVVRATRNGTDLTARFDFSKFRIHFTDSTYSIDSPLPFVVSKSGTWGFDDPRFPFNLSFTATDSSAKSSPMSFPVVGGQRSIIITFSPGCNLNSYQYTLQKVN